MPIREFSLGPKKSLLKAECKNLPDIVIITGPNGAGKSSLLTLLRDAPRTAPTDAVLHIGAYRPWRKSTLSKSSVLGWNISYNAMLAQTHIPHFNIPPGGIQMFQGSFRDTDSSDEAQSLVKVALAKMHEKFKDKLASIYQESGQVKNGALGDPFKPLKTLLHRLLPHLDFVGIKDYQETDFIVLFRSHYRPEAGEFDIDELSAGEKAVISLFLPVLEFQIEKVLGIEREDSARTFLIDEPELHLHPALQADVLAYMRALSISDKIQFIMATHSPTIIDAALQSELYMILPWRETGNANQFVPVADSYERLIAIKEISGSAFAYSRSRPVLFLEGEFPGDTKKATDLGLLELVMPDIRGYICVPSHGKSEAIKAAAALRRASDEQQHLTTAFALVDADYDASGLPWVMPWQVCMIENLLLDKSSIAFLLRPYLAKGALDEQAIANALDNILSEMRQTEIDRRLKSSARSITLRPVFNVDGKLTFNIEAAAEEAGELLSKVEACRKNIKDKVSQELADGIALRRFHGKTVLSIFFDLHVKKYIQNYNNFVIQLGQIVALRGSAASMMSDSINKIKNYFPTVLKNIIFDPSIEPVCSEAAVDVSKLRHWAAIKSQVFDGTAKLGQAQFDCERDLIKILATAQVNNAELYKKLRPLVVDCISK